MGIPKVLLALLVLSLIAGCSETAPKDEQVLQQNPEVPNRVPSPAPKPSKAEIENLIAQLKSSNRNPNPDMERLITGPPVEYDVKAQERVKKAYAELVALGKDAFPLLIEHLNDKEYSLSFSTAIWRSFTVGEACFMIINDQIDIIGMTYKGRIGKDGKDHTYVGYFEQFCSGAWFTKDGIERWWKENQDKSLREMQIQVLQWKIENEKKIGFPKAKDKENYLHPLVAKLRELESQ